MPLKFNPFTGTFDITSKVSDIHSGQNNIVTNEIIDIESNKEMRVKNCITNRGCINNKGKLIID